MDHSLYFPAVVAAADFNPFTKEVAMPVTVQSGSTRPRAASKPGGVTRPVRKNLLELGLAYGEGAAELDARAQQADAARHEADRSAGVGAAGVERDAPAAEGGEAKADDPAAIAAMAGEIREIVRQRDRLTEELANLDKQRAELQAKLMQALGKAGVPSRPTAPEPPALPLNEFLPKAAWR